MRVSKLAAVATAIVLAASMASGGCSSSTSGTSGGAQGTLVCTSADVAACPTGAGVMQLCVTGNGPQCLGAYMKVGSQTFTCNSCDDTTGCNDQAAAYCYGDAGRGSASGSSGSSGGGSSGSSGGSASDAQAE